MTTISPPTLGTSVNENHCDMSGSTGVYYVCMLKGKYHNQLTIMAAMQGRRKVKLCTMYLFSDYNKIYGN